MSACRKRTHWSMPALVIWAVFAAMLPASMGDRAALAQEPSIAVIADEGVDPTALEFVRESVALAESIFAARLQSPATRQLTVILRPGAANLSETYGIYNDDVIEIFTGSRSWTARSDIERVKGVLHEYAHFYLDPAPYPKQRPVWLEEGLAEFLAWQFLEELELVSHSEMLAYHAAHVRIWPPAEQLCALTPRSISGVAYPLVHLGAAVLVQDLPFAAIAQYRDAMAAGSAHEDAFESAFLRSEAEFCADADTLIGALPPAVSMPADLFVRDAPVPGTFAELIDAPRSVRPGEQVIVRARTNESALCELSFQHLSNSASMPARPARADGAGTVFWLVTLPLGTVSGEANWAMTCGSGKDESPVMVTLRRDPRAA